MTKFLINNGTDAWKTDVNLLNGIQEKRRYPLFSVPASSFGVSYCFALLITVKFWLLLLVLRIPGIWGPAFSSWFCDSFIDCHVLYSKWDNAISCPCIYRSFIVISSVKNWTSLLTIRNVSSKKLFKFQNSIVDGRFLDKYTGRYEIWR